MNEQIVCWGDDQSEYEIFSEGVTGTMRSWDPSNPGLVQGGMLAIEPTLGPLAHKRQRLESLAGHGIRTILTASVTVTIAVQQGWVGKDVTLIGFDPLLVRARGSQQTIVVHDDGNVSRLTKLWPKWTFVAISDAVGLIFSREILPIINESVDFLGRGVSPLDIDLGVRLGLNYPRGPMAWAELFGWVNVYWGLRALEDMYGPRFRPHPWIRAQVGSSLLEREA